MTFRARLFRVALAGLAMSLPVWLLTLNDDDDCRDIGGCLSLVLDEFLVIPVLALVSWPLLRLLGVPRAFLHTGMSWLLGGLAWSVATGVCDTLDPGRVVDQPLPLVAAVLVGPTAGAAAAYLVGPSPGSRARQVLRILPPVALLALGVATSATAVRAEQAHRVAEIERTAASAGITTYRPELAGTVPDHVSTRPDELTLYYRVGEGAALTVPRVRLVPTPQGSLCASLQPSPAETCTDDGRVMHNVYGGYADVALVRGGTTLVVEGLRTGVLGIDATLEALSDAPVATPAELAGDR